VIEFQAWPKIPRLKKDMIITEKIDGTNAAVVIEKVEHGSSWRTDQVRSVALRAKPGGPAEMYLLAAQSRTRLITPEKDNFGFARWAYDNAADLVRLLGPGRHFGEWWGPGIQRGYGIPEKKFSLFNVNRYAGLTGVFHQIDVVPELYRGPFSIEAVNHVLADLYLYGSDAAPGFMKPEGVVVYHVGAGTTFKAFVDPDVEAAPKGGQ
jgi:hypothetical protein